MSPKRALTPSDSQTASANQDLNRQDLRQADRLVRNVFFHAKYFFEGHQHNFATLNTDHRVALAREQVRDGGGAEDRGEQAIVRGGRAAALRVTQNADFGVVGALCKVRGQALGQAGLLAFGHDDDARGLASGHATFDRAENLAEVLGALWHDHGFGAAADADFERDETAGAAHDFDQKDAVMGAGGIADPVDRDDGRIDGGIKPDRVFGFGDVVVDRARNADGRKAVFALQQMRARERTVAADDDQAIDAFATENIGGFTPDRLLVKRKAAISLEDRAAALDDIGDRRAAQRLNLPFKQTAVALLHAVNFAAMRESEADHGPDRGVHAGRIAAAGENRD